MPVWTFGASFGLAMPISKLYEGCEWIHLPPSSSKTLAFLINTLQENWRCWLNLDCAKMAGGKNEKRKRTCVVSYHDISLLTTI
jgi:hypothetical protein